MIRLLPLLALIFSPVAFADMNLGFQSSDSGAIPNLVREQQKFIYRFDIPFFTTVIAAGYEDIKKLPQLPAAGVADIELCQAKMLPTCVVHFAETRGSAVLDTSGDSIWTNCHMVHGWIEYQRQASLLAGVAENDLFKSILNGRISFRLRGKDGFDLSTSGNLAAFWATNITTPAELNCSKREDAVKIQLPVRLAEKGPVRAKKIVEGETLFAGGYPHATESRDPLGFADSDGESFYWTHGPHWPKKEMPASATSLAFSGDETFGFLADGAEGQSGGGVFNARGELVGIYKAYLPAKEGSDIPLVSMVYTGLRFVEIYFGTL